MNFFKKNKRKVLLFLTDYFIYTAVYVFVFLISHLNLKIDDVGAYAINYAIFAVSIFASRLAFRVYSNVWRYVNCKAYIEMLCADALGALIALSISFMIHLLAFISIWKSAAVVAIACLGTLAIRFAYQELHRANSIGISRSNEDKTKVAIIGAGRIGALLAEELICFRASKYIPVFFIDSDSAKVGSRVAGLPVYENGEEALKKIKLHGIKELIITIQNLNMETVGELFEYYGKENCDIKLYDYPMKNINDQNGKRVIREVKIEDLLFRDSITLIDDDTKDFYMGKTVLVTGGGGSIGSELCRQIARCSPKKLVIFDIYENNAYDIQQELIRHYGGMINLVVEIGSVRDRERLEVLFANHRPDIVFHAAAHKHVPLMEHNNAEAIKNNVFGTYNTADMAEKYRVKKFILISTDKAVNPTNVMGASKRMCEMVVKCRTDSKTVFSAVRFGNVLGSNGSVIPLFKRQIAEGGPITITDKRIVRYFMTIPEASGLVMQAGAMAKRGELFVLDMGKPVKIIDLAINMVRLSGYEPYKDIMIKEIGLRPGEKLYEELLVDREKMHKTESDMIFIENEESLTRAEVEEKLSVLREAVEKYQSCVPSPEITRAMKSVVPTFYTPDEINNTAERSDEMKKAENAVSV